MISSKLRIKNQEPRMEFTIEGEVVVNNIMKKKNERYRGSEAPKSHSPSGFGG